MVDASGQFPVHHKKNSAKKLKELIIIIISVIVIERKYVLSHLYIIIAIWGIGCIVLVIGVIVNVALNPRVSQAVELVVLC